MADFGGVQFAQAAFGVARGDDAHANRLPLDEIILAPELPFVGTFSDDGQKSNKVTETSYTGASGEAYTGTIDWYEDFHVVPRAFEFGNILTEVQEPIEVYSAFRNDARTWAQFINNAGAGVRLLGQPTLPTVVQPQSGIQMTLVIETSGEANVDTTLDFVFTGVGTAVVTIVLQRVVLFNLVPESAIREELEWLTQLYRHDDGTEQRESIRVYPRQFFNWTVIAEDGVERSYAENILFEWQSRIFGVPVWHELTRLTTAATATDTTITVKETANRDFREEGLVLIFADQFTFDVGTIVTGGVGGTTITVDSGILNSYPVGTRVVPLRTGALVRNVQGRRYPSGAQELQLRFRVDDNVVDLADDSTWTKFNTKVVLDDPNLIDGTLEESFTQDIVVIDNATGKVTLVPKVNRNRRQHGKGFFCQGLAALWRVRQLLHALRGRQVSCYIPTFAKDLVPIDDLNSASTDLVISNVGYTQFVQSRQTRNALVVFFKDGSTPLYRTITSSNLDSATQETLTVNIAWPATYTPSEIDRISYVEEVRQNSDRVTIDHDPNGRTHRVLTNLIGVYE